MENKCLYCYESIDSQSDLHEKCSMAFFGSRKAPRVPYTISQMAELAKNVVERSISVPGVQAKLSMSLIDNTLGETGKRLTVVGALGGYFTLKPPAESYPEMPQNEHLTMRLAESFGIRVVPSSLIRLESGELSYITKRIDRKGEAAKIHMIDMFQILEATDKYRSSIEKIGQALTAYSANPMLDKLFFLELTLFNFLIGNSDMHLKNFSMLQEGFGWILSPAYDLLNTKILLPEDLEEMALTLEGKKSRFKKEHFERFGTTLGLTNRQIDGVFKRFLEGKQQALEWIGKSLLSTEMKQQYANLMQDRYKRIYDPVQ